MPAVATKAKKAEVVAEQTQDSVGKEPGQFIKSGRAGVVLPRDPQTGRVKGYGGDIDTEGQAGSTPELKAALDAADVIGAEVTSHFKDDLKATRDAKTGMFLKGAIQPGAVIQARQAAKHRTVIMASVSTSDVQEVLLALMLKAKQGNLPAIVEFFNRVIGKPLEADVLERLHSLEEIARMAANGQMGSSNAGVAQGQAALASANAGSTATPQG